MAGLVNQSVLSIMEVYLAFNLNDWSKRDIFDYIRGADSMLDLVPERIKPSEVNVRDMSKEQQLVLL